VEKATLKKRRNGFRPNKRLGQHFLKDRGIIDEIIDRAGFHSSDRILEIGAGLGALTLPLAASVHQILAVEKDGRLTAMLDESLTREGIRNVTLINELLPHPGGKIHVIGNLPYNISSPLLEKLITHRHLIARAVLMFQFELARRLIASPGNKAYGAMTVLIRYHTSVSPLLEVPKGAFYPKPKVGSMVLELDFERPYPRRADDEAHFKKVVRGAFAHRRKTILNSFKGAFFSCGIDELLKAFEKCEIDSKKRAETLSIDDYICLSAALGCL
jgi:16S rRNA (adenine1518-N6/adenine1519-N6)-dimethyltransferase